MHWFFGAAIAGEDVRKSWFLSLETINVEGLHVRQTFTDICVCFSASQKGFLSQPRGDHQALQCQVI